MTDEETTERQNELTRIVNDAIAALRHHFDSVQIFATIHDPASGETERINIGDGNWFTRYGQVCHWLKLENARIPLEIVMDDDDDDDE